ncbi:helix-turn-helix domain-containing protein [Gluconacetobacter azotocaptans]|uniref:Helix-turn-helix domain-containing protein n=1 Tax=Gluconacetobacter azotocaptans TaxID=142834 RepID=A0A7W4JVG7_9PROT|nr:helix-turn-helix domain-containing protein [Gluconacetobacter azotocaptans]MBB2191642.1 helix-turn-helix domain-containing protein [Gluconacetobacter azotocaptans]GBQ33990.1 AraC family transcriptional regulator [Gluconacetobacter azotocaptans DSM 13594]
MTTPEPHEIVLVAYPGAQQAALHGMEDLFAVADEQARTHLDRNGPLLRVTTITEDPPPATTPSVIIVPPTLTGSPAPETMTGLLAWMRTCHERGTILAAVCAGTFLLAATGVLDGRAATTHWRSAERLRALHPTIRVDPDRLLVDDGDILTVAGVMSWPDLGLRLIEKLLGPMVMAETARDLLIDPPRRDQRHYRQFAPVLTHGDRAILTIQHWLRTDAAREARVAEMVRVSGLEERTFLRRFRKATGISPREYAQHLRVERARDLLETTVLPLERIAWEAGYQDTGAFKKLFFRLTGLSPAEYRERFTVRPTF